MIVILFLSSRRARSFVFRDSVRLRLTGVGNGSSIVENRRGTERGFLSTDRAADTAFPCINGGCQYNHTMNQQRPEDAGGGRSRSRIKIKIGSERTTLDQTGNELFVTRSWETASLTLCIIMMVLMMISPVWKRFINYVVNP